VYSIAPDVKVYLQPFTGIVDHDERGVCRIGDRLYPDNHAEAVELIYREMRQVLISRVIDKTLGIRRSACNLSDPDWKLLGRRIKRIEQWCDHRLETHRKNMTVAKLAGKF
jgi:hypothetical protein